MLNTERYIDLTIAVSPNTPTFPGSPTPQFIPWADLNTDGYNLELVFFSSHTGTHLDSPYHFDKDGIKVDQIHIKRLIGSGILIQVPKPSRGKITRSDISNFEKEFGTIPPDSSIFFHTGWDKRLKRSNYFTENPGLDTSAANYLKSKRVNLVGIDSPSIDVGVAAFPVHKILSKNNILIVENLTNLDKIRTHRFDFTLLPLKLKDATGSPIRAIASQ